MSGTWYHTYSKSRVKDIEIPKLPHWVVMVFSDRRYSERGYDRDDPDTTNTIRTCDYYAFHDKAQWEKMIQDIYREQYERRNQGWSHNSDNENIVFFHSGGRGEVNFNVNITPVIRGDV